MLFPLNELLHSLTAIFQYVTVQKDDHKTWQISMQSTIGVGTSKHSNPSQAGREAAQSALLRLQPRQIAAGIVFSSMRYASDFQALLQGIKAIIGTAPLIGCSTAGEVFLQQSQQHSIVLLLIPQTNEIVCAASAAQGVSKRSREVGHEIALQARNQYDRINPTAPRQFFLYFSDGLQGNATELLRGIQEVLGTGSIIVGGGASDSLLFHQTHQFFQQHVLTDAATGMLLGGNLAIGVGIAHGFRPLGKPRTVTQIKETTIISIDHLPARAIYEYYFEDSETTEPSLDNHQLTALYPMGIQTEDTPSYLIRSAIDIDSQGHLVCNADVPYPSHIRLMMATHETVIESAQQAATQALQNLHGAPPLCCLILESTGRKQLLGRRTESELQLIQETIGAHVPIIGFYSYAEQAPMSQLAPADSTICHNNSIVVLLLGESA